MLLKDIGLTRADLNAPFESLASEVREKVQEVYELVEQVTAAKLSGRDMLSSWTTVIQYLNVRMSVLKEEQFRVLFLDRKNRLIKDAVLGRGTIDHAPVYPREVIREALELRASAMILVHNHPSGDTTLVATLPLAVQMLK